MAVVAALSTTLLVSAVLTVPRASADPLPGYDLDPAELERRMDTCMAMAMPANEIIMGWVSFRTGARRQWRCSSLRHMILDVHDRDEGNAHDPWADIPNFMRCVDEVVSYGFPRRASKPEHTMLIKQFNGTAGKAIVIVNDETGDVVTVFTKDVDNLCQTTLFVKA